MGVGVVGVIPPCAKVWVKTRRCKNLAPHPLDLKILEVRGQTELGFGLDLGFDVLETLELGVPPTLEEVKVSTDFGLAI